MTRTLMAAKPRAELTKALVVMEATQQRGTWCRDDLGPLLLALDIVKDEYPRLRPEVARSAVNKAMGVAA